MLIESPFANNLLNPTGYCGRDESQEIDILTNRIVCVSVLLALLRVAMEVRLNVPLTLCQAV